MSCVNVVRHIGGIVQRKLSTTLSVLAVILAGTFGLTACTSGEGGTPVSVAPTVMTPDPASVQSASAAAEASMAQAASEKSKAQKAQADMAAAAKAAASKAAASKSAASEAAESAAAASRAAASEEAARSSAAEQSAAEQAAADQAAAEQAAAESAAESAAAEEAAAAEAAAQADAATNGWTTPSGSYVSPETAARALAAGIAPGEEVPGYLRCGTICGESPTSGEVMFANACKEGLVSAAECADIDVEGILAAAGR